MPEWEDLRPRFRESALCFKEHGPRKAVVIQVRPGVELGSGKARMYEAWLGDRKLYDPADEYAVGQVVKLEG